MKSGPRSSIWLDVAGIAAGFAALAGFLWLITRFGFAIGGA